MARFFHRLCFQNGFKSFRSLSDAARSTEGFDWSGVLLLIPPAFAFGLGFWQIQRKAWKARLDDRVATTKAV